MLALGAAASSLTFAGGDSTMFLLALLSNNFYSVSNIAFSPDLIILGWL